LTAAFHDTADLLARPWDAELWLKLSILCLFLGGGTPSAAFNWSLGSLPGDIGFREFMGRVRETVTAHAWVIALLVFLGSGLLALLLYLRSVFRFVLVDAICRRDVRFRSGLAETRRMGRSYFRWLLAALLVVTLTLLAGGALAYPYLRAAAGMRSFAFWATLVAILLVDILMGLAFALVIVLTDDLVVPIMYAERLPLLAGWRRLAKQFASEPWAFTVYVFVRFVVAVGVSMATLFLLFPLLVGLFSGAIITGGVVVLALHGLGLVWSWNPLTIAFAATGLAALLSLMLMILSVVGMPAQVFMQDFGIRFIAARVPSVEAVLPARSAGVPEGEAPLGAISS